MNTFAILAMLIVYIAGMELIKRRVSLPENVSISYGSIILGTQYGKHLLNRLADAKKTWTVWNTIATAIGFPIMIGAVWLFITSALRTFRVRPEPTAANQPANMLVIPGVNDYLPLSVAPEIIIGLVLGMVVHELGHGISCRVDNIGVDKLGAIFFGIIPLGAFVQPDEDELGNASTMEKLRMFAAGIMNNLALTAICLVLLFGPITGAMSVAAGIPIANAIPSTAADDSALDKGDVIQSVDGVSISTISELNTVLLNNSADPIPVTLKSGETVSVDRKITITKQVSFAPDALGPKTTLTKVNGTSVDTRGEFIQQLAPRDFAELTTKSGETVVTPVGVAATPNTDGSLAMAGAPSNETIYITHLNNTRILTTGQLTSVLKGTTPGDHLTVRAIVDGDVKTYTATLQQSPNSDSGFLGVNAYPGISGMTITDFGVKSYPASTYLAILSEDSSLTIFQQLLFMVFLPAATLAGLPYNFSGFTGGVENFYTISGMLAPFGDGVFILANILYWTAWINLNLAIFNLIPIYGLDGGHMMNAVFKHIGSKFGVSEETAFKGTVVVSLFVTGTILFSLFAPLYL